MPTLYKISTYQFLLILLKETNCEQSSIIITLHVVSLYLKYNEGFFFRKRLSMGGQTFLGTFLGREVILHGGTNNQIHTN